jgi:hypothetical protein
MSEVELRLTRPMTGLALTQEFHAVEFPPLDPDSPSPTVLDPVGDVLALEAERHQAVVDLAQHIAMTVQQVQGLVQARLDELSRYAVELGLGLAEKICEHEIEAGRMDPTPHVVECLRGAVQGVTSGSIIVRLNPADLSHVMSEIDRMESPETRNDAVRFDVDPTIGRGACRVETSIGRIVHDPRDVVQQALERVREEAGLDLA